MLPYVAAAPQRNSGTVHIKKIITAATIPGYRTLYNPTQPSPNAVHISPPKNATSSLHDHTNLDSTALDTLVLLLRLLHLHLLLRLPSIPILPTVLHLLLLLLLLSRIPSPSRVRVAV